MIIAIDDSGDPGLKFDRGSSRYLTIASVYFRSDRDASSASRMIGELREKYHFAKRFEFKFRKASDKLRRDFLKSINSVHFSVSISTVDKNLTHNKISPNDLYNATVLESIKNIKNANDLEIYLDGQAGKNYRRKVWTFLRKNLPKGVIRNFNYRDSRNDDLIQLADMVVGAANYAIVNGDDRYLRIISDHIR